MLRQTKILIVFLVISTLTAAAQVTGSGTGGTIPVFTGSGTSSTVGNSVVTQSSGNVGIGTTTPGSTLSVVGSSLGTTAGNTSNLFSLYNIDASGSLLNFYQLRNSNGSDWTTATTRIQQIIDTTGMGYIDFNPPSGGFGIAFGSGVCCGSTTTAIEYMRIASGGNVGIGTTDPPSPLTVDSANVTSLVALKDGGSTIWNMGIGDTSGGYFSIGDGGSNTNRFVIQKTSGNVGIGTTSPGAPLEVHGNVKVSGSGASITFPDSTVQSTAWTGTLTGGDYAESVDITGDRAKYEPGDVLDIDRSHPGHFLKSVDRYSKRVAGVYSTKPGMVGRRQTTDKALCTTEVPMAMVGIVPTKVSAENGPIESGDLLVTSSTVGYAMKGTDPALMMGAVIGKAIDSLDSGKGVIEVLISLQ